jgi:hypothetical protein
MPMLHFSLQAAYLSSFFMSMSILHVSVSMMHIHV